VDTFKPANEMLNRAIDFVLEATAAAKHVTNLKPDTTTNLQY
jgi:hypothetical protein